MPIYISIERERESMYTYVYTYIIQMCKALMVLGLL